MIPARQSDFQRNPNPTSGEPVSRVTHDPLNPRDPVLRGDCRRPETEIRRLRSSGGTQELGPASPENPRDSRTRETRPSRNGFPATFSAESVANSGGFAMKILGIISYDL
jgi:hypothetical protein